MHGELLNLMDAPLADFNFNVLDDPEFKEDAVREEIIVPIIKALGYDVTGKHRIVRSRALEHPFVAIGSIKKRINIIPDYILYADERIGWILDAKAPTEAVDDPEHVAQAYSYAIHRDVHAVWFALCNGREFALYNVADMSRVARLRFNIAEIGSYWPKMKRMLLPPAVASFGIPYKKDLGIHLLKLGFPPNLELTFFQAPVANLGRIHDDLYSIQVSFNSEGTSYLGCFDFKGRLLLKLLSGFPAHDVVGISNQVRRWPSLISIESTNHPTVTIIARRGNDILENDKEHYIPFEVIDFR